MTLDMWALVSTLFKFGSYVGVSVALGTLLFVFLYRPALKRQIKFISVMSLVGAVSTVGYFLLQVGAFSQSGLLGMFDVDILKLLYTTGNGDLLIFRAFGLVYFAAVWSVLNKILLRSHWSVTTSLLMPAIMSVLWSFTTVGHISDLAWYWQGTLILHIFVALAWIGSLQPLYKLVEGVDTKQVNYTLHQYSKIGTGIVILLLAAGLSLTYKLIILDNNQDSIEYLIALLSKVTLVVIMFGLAAYHKFNLAEKVKKGEVDKNKVALSIKRENIIGYSVLLITAILTTVVGINH